MQPHDDSSSVRKGHIPVGYTILRLLVVTTLT